MTLILTLCAPQAIILVYELILTLCAPQGIILVYELILTLCAPQGIILVYELILTLCAPQGIILVYELILTLCAPQGIILVYDITNQKSFDNIQKWLSNIEMASTYMYMYTVHGLSIICNRVFTVSTARVIGRGEIADRQQV